jgi:hypothetical protein
MEEVLDVYKRPVDASHPLVCMDEVNTQLLKEVLAAFACRAKAASTAGLRI